MKLVEETTSPTRQLPKKSKKVKKSKELQANGEDTTELIAKALKKPRTRSVSLTLSENGIEDDAQLPPPVSSNPRLTTKKSKKDKATLKAVIEDEQDENAVLDDGVPAEHAAGRFSNFPIREKTIVKLKAKGIKYLFPVQAQTFKKVLEGKDVIAKARTGTGKTLAFALPLVEKLETEHTKVVRGRPPRVIVLAPTRELVNQITKDFQAISSLSIHAFYGGVTFHEQGQALRSGIDVLVGTPGRLLDWVNKGQLDTGQLEHVVLDEVDQMLDMGFAYDVESIISLSYNRGEGMGNPQTLLFSATLPAWVTRTAKKYMETMPPIIDLVGNSLNQTATNVTHLAIRSHWKDRASDVSKIIQYYSGDQGRAMVFCPTKKDVDELSVCSEIKQTKEKLHGDVKQASREAVLERFRQGSTKVLITTNVAARGLDIPEVDVVLQTNPPSDIESYIHRSGRTGRAGKSGISICLYTNRYEADLVRVERFAKLSFKRVNVPSGEEIASIGVKDTLSAMAQIDDAVIDRFKQTAEELISKQGGAVQTVAALIAIITGQTSVSTTSLINDREGFVTFLYKTNATLKFKGYVYNLLKNRCGLEINDAIKHMSLTKDMQGAAFDLPGSSVAQFESTMLFESANESIVKAVKLPEMQQYASQGQYGDWAGQSTHHGGRSGGGGGWRGGARGGYGSRNSDHGMRQGGGFKRPMSGCGDGSQNKKIKFV